ncbi:tol-pal system protein YbgF [Elusimicrobium simillimum]|uniref:tetratricopeptide repeat protein n=1 Tax=Elusimicrobium simillimum TaxID=3143438 RepID=UPI003C6FD246
MKNLLKSFFILGLGSFVFYGCATDKDMRDLKTQISSLTKILSEMQENQADLSYKIEELSTDINVTNENMHETGEMITRLSAKLDDLSVATSTVAQHAAEAAIVLPTTIFENAKTNLNEKKYDSAIEGFNLYLTKYPEGELVEEANALIGDAHYGKKEWKEAAVVYATLMQKYPKSKKTAAYRLKYAQSILPLNKKTEAKKYLQSVSQDFPKSAEAKVAAKELAAIK